MDSDVCRPLKRALDKLIGVGAIVFHAFSVKTHPLTQVVLTSSSLLTHHSSSNIASASIVISMMLLTTRPPRSRVSFQLTAKSWRLIEVLATKPARVFGPLSAPFSHQGVCHWPR